ncbi:hypothetical protein MMC14_003077 [Varicellaria rhodocarpa]|nr:hypothetical protein [Varicellaria rhodocarpa]
MTNQLHKHPGLPRTPYPIAMKAAKRFISYDEQEFAKKRKIMGDETNLNILLPLENLPVLKSICFPMCLQHGISPTELKRASESVLNQVDWSKVVLDTVGSNKAAIYRHVFEVILHNAQVQELLNQGSKGTTKFEDEKGGLNNGPMNGAGPLNHFTSTDEDKNEDSLEFCLGEAIKDKHTEDGGHSKDFESIKDYEDFDDIEDFEDYEDDEDNKDNTNNEDEDEDEDEEDIYGCGVSV